METIRNILPWIQVALSAILIGFVLIQQNEAGLGGNQGGSQIRTKRGLEKALFIFTIIVAVLFAASSLLALWLGSN
jgi:preprotein translocase subunit SecG